MPYPTDTQVLNIKRNFRVLRRNVDRTPKGSTVSIGYTSSVLKPPDYMLVSEANLVIATSMDKDDLILFIIENEWITSDPEITAVIKGVLNETQRNA